MLKVKNKTKQKMIIHVEPAIVITRWQCCICGHIMEKPATRIFATIGDETVLSDICSTCIYLGQEIASDRLRGSLSRAIRDVENWPTMETLVRAELDACGDTMSEKEFKKCVKRNILHIQAYYLNDDYAKSRLDKIYKRLYAKASENDIPF